MSEQPDPRVKNPYAIPTHALVADADLGHDQLVTLQPSRPVNDWTPSSGDIGAGADGDGD